MKNLLKATTLIIVMLALPAMAADSGSPMPMNMQHGGTGMDNMQHGNMNMQQGAMQMEGMNMGGNMEPLGDVTVDGVIAQGHVTDVRMEMAKAKQPYTHHLMVMFKDKDGKAMLKGRVAVKVTGADGKTGEAATMMADSTHFGADLALPAPGAYTFTVGSKFEDG